MNCKNCNQKLKEKDLFCVSCGGKIVTARVSVKKLWIEFSTTVLGWDNKYFFTLRMMLFHPRKVLEEYLSGTRKKYVNPLTFFALSAAIALIVFNVFVEDYVKMGSSINEYQVKKIYNFQKTLEPDVDFETYRKKVLQESENGTRVVIKYFNLFSFVLLPIYTLLSFFVFWKRNFFGEHLVVNAFVQGTTFWFAIAAFGVAMLFNMPSVFMASTGFVMLFYLYVYGTFYKLKIGKVLLYLLKFFGVLLVFIFVAMLLLVIAGFLIRFARDMLI